MKKRVLHFVRKSSQLKTSFIKNQITHHVNYEPFIVCRKNVDKEKDGGFAEFNLDLFEYLDLSLNETIIEKIKYKTIRTITKRQIRLIENFIKEKSIDICHFHYGTDCGVFYPLLEKIKIPSVVSFYGYDVSFFPNRFLGYGKFFLRNRVFKKVKVVLAMTEEMKKDLINIGCPPEKIIVHYHGVPSEIFLIKRNNYGSFKERDFVLLNVANYNPVKGHIFIFQAIKRLIDHEDIKIQLRIVGKNYNNSIITDFISKNRLEKYIKFLGPLKYGSREIVSEYINADAFIHPSVTTNEKEGIPGTIVEAMMAGLPVISTYHGGIPYVIKNYETGLLVNEWDIDGLANAIKTLYINRGLCIKIGTAGQEYALKNLDIIEKEKELEDIYDMLIDKFNF